MHTASATELITAGGYSAASTTDLNTDATPVVAIYKASYSGGFQWSRFIEDADVTYQTKPYYFGKQPTISVTHPAPPQTLLLWESYLYYKWENNCKYHREYPWYSWSLLFCDHNQYIIAVYISDLVFKDTVGHPSDPDNEVEHWIGKTVYFKIYRPNGDVVDEGEIYTVPSVQWNNDPPYHVKRPSVVWNPELGSKGKWVVSWEKLNSEDANAERWTATVSINGSVTVDSTSLYTCDDGDGCGLTSMAFCTDDTINSTGELIVRGEEIGSYVQYIDEDGTGGMTGYSTNPYTIDSYSSSDIAIIPDVDFPSSSEPAGYISLDVISSSGNCITYNSVWAPDADSTYFSSSYYWEIDRSVESSAVNCSRVSRPLSISSDAGGRTFVGLVAKPQGPGYTSWNLHLISDLTN